VTRHDKSAAFTIERLASDCLDVRELRRKGLFGGDWVTFRPMLRWPVIAQLRRNAFKFPGPGLTSEASGHGCIALTARGAWPSSMRASEAISAEPASAIRFMPAKPSALRLGRISRHASCGCSWAEKLHQPRRFLSDRVECICVHMNG
jgi:hypothetical protein